MSAHEQQEGGSPVIAEIVDGLKTLQRAVGSLAPGHRQGLLFVAIERALAIAEHYETPLQPAARPRRQCASQLGSRPCILEDGHPRAHRSATGKVWA